MRQAALFRYQHRSVQSETAGGQSVVELALMLPILTLLLIGILDLGRIYFSYIAVINVAREGARYAAAHPPAKCNPLSDVSAIQERARHEAIIQFMNPAQLQIAVWCLDPSVDQFITVNVRYDFQMIAARMLGFPPIPLRQEATMQIFGR